MPKLTLHRTNSLSLFIIPVTQVNIFKYNSNLCTSKVFLTKLVKTPMLELEKCPKHFLRTTRHESKVVKDWTLCGISGQSVMIYITFIVIQSIYNWGFLELASLKHIENSNICYLIDSEVLMNHFKWSHKL